MVRKQNFNPYPLHPHPALLLSEASRSNAILVAHAPIFERDEFIRIFVEPFERVEAVGEDAGTKLVSEDVLRKYYSPDCCQRDRHGDSASGAVCKRQAGAPATLKVRRRRDSKEVASRTVYMYRPEGDPRAARDALGQVLRKLNLLQAEKMGGGAESSYLYGGSFVQVNA